MASKGMVTGALVGLGVLVVGAGIASARSKDKVASKPKTGSPTVPKAPPPPTPGPDDDTPETPEAIETDFPEVYKAARELEGLIGVRTRESAYRKRALVEILSAWLDSEGPDSVPESEAEWVGSLVSTGANESGADISLISQAEWQLNHSDEPTTLRGWASGVQPVDPELAGALRTKAGEIEAARGAGG